MIARVGSEPTTISPRKDPWRSYPGARMEKAGELLIVLLLLVMMMMMVVPVTSF